MQETRRAVLDALADGPVPGPALAERLGVSRAAVWKHVDALREAGFEVEGGEGGYVLASVPEFGGPAVEFGLDAPFSVEFHGSVGSTNARARELAEAGAGDVVVLADEQTGGRGRLDRAWASPSGGVWMSLLLRPALRPAEVPLLTLAAGVATVRAVESVGVDAGLKWPNDVLVSSSDATGAERKLAGILTEMAGETDRTDWVIVGIGLNANVDAGALPPGATSLREERGGGEGIGGGDGVGEGEDDGDVERRLLVQRLLESFDELRADPAAVLPAWREAALTLGRRVRVTTPEGEVVGEAVDVEAPGRLVIDTDDGPVRVHAGDCEHLRPADG